jgi:N-acetylglucosamine-6-phosphate deacetylase
VTTPVFYQARAVLTPQGWLDGHGVLVAGGVIQAVLAAAPAGVSSATLPPEALLVPGYIDIQVNGGGGVLFNDDPSAATARHIAAAHRKLGTTGILPTLITSPPADMSAAAASLPAALGQGVLGLHFEGPFLSPQKPGVHRRDYLRAPDAADLALLTTLARVSSAPVLLTLAPECVDPGALAALADAGVILSAGHSAATLAQIPAAITGVTHIFNAMAPITARAPGLAAAGLGPALYAGVIADLIHVHPALLRLLAAAKPADRIILVSDSMSVAGTDAANFTLQGRRILRRDGRLQTEDGTLAGADLSLAQAVRNMVQLGIPPARAIAWASTVPADFLRIGATSGRIAPGRAADITVLTEQLEVIGTVLGGDYAAA